MKIWIFGKFIWWWHFFKKNWNFGILELFFKNGSFGKLFEKWNFEKLNLKIGTLENYFYNEILENLKIGVLKNYLKIEVKIRLFENLEFWKLF